MCETGLATLGNGDLTRDRSDPFTVLNRIAQSLHLPIEAFYGPAQHALDEGSVGDIQTDQLLVLVKAHMSRLDPSARRRFGAAIVGMIDPDTAED